MQIGAAAGAEAEATRVRYEEQRKRRAASIAQIIPKPAMIDYIMRKVKCKNQNVLNELKKCIYFLTSRRMKNVKYN